MIEWDPAIAALHGIISLSLAERVGFEPTVPLRVHLISSQARSTELRHLSDRVQVTSRGLAFHILLYQTDGRPQGQ